MSALSKKLLSWLCVVAMVVAMVPAVALPASAEETEAAPEIQYGTANLPEGTQEIIDAAKAIQDADLAAHVEAGTCPICGTVEGGWQEATYPKQTKVEGEKRHYYVKDSTAVSKQYNWYAGNAKNMTLCLALLNTTTPKEIGGLIGLRNSASGCTINIMGNGTITSDGTKTADSQFGVVCLQGSSNTLNLYGGTFIYTGDGQGRNKIDSNGDGVIDEADTEYEPSGVISAGAITVKGQSNTVNIFDGVTIGPETQDVTKPCYNVVVQLGKASSTDTVNMYGGTIRNGVSNLANTSGNVHLHYDKELTEGGAKPTKPTLNLYGGTISGGTFVEGRTSANGGNIYCGPGAQLNISGGTVTGGKALNNGGNIFANDSGICKVNISGGIIEKGEGKNGGNIYSSAPVNLSGTALIRDGVATSDSGGNITLTGSSRKATISGGKIVGGTAENSQGGNIRISNKETVISGGIIEGGTAKHGGNLGVSTDLQITGGTIQGGTATGSNGGGNIFGSGSKTITITGGIIQNGKSTNASGGGGNLRVNCAAVNIGGDAQILGGEAGFMGGSIYVTTKCVMTVDGNAVISGGRSNNDGGNIALYNGGLTVGGNAQIKDGKATRYEATYNEETGKVAKESFVADGGNIYCFGYSETVDEVKTYTNELTIKDNAVISGGWAVRGGNISAENTTVNIESGVVIKDGCAGLEVDGEMTYTAVSDTVGRGGNIFHGTKECEVNIAATLSGGKGRFGANLAVYSGTVNFSGIMEGGHTTSFGGNACVQGATLNLEAAELRNATSNGQAGNIRVYNGTLNMNGGKIYGGDDLSKNNTDNVWLVRSTLNMSGDATVTGTNAYGSAVRLVAYSGYPSVVTLADTATVVGETQDVMTVQKNGDGDQSILYINEGWAGTAYIATTDYYSYGETINNDTVVVGSFAEDGTFTKGGTYTGTLLRAGAGVFGVEGDAVVAAAGYVSEDGTKSWYLTNNEALAAYQHSQNAYVILSGATADIPETVSELNVDITGREVTFTGNATIYGSDSANDDYSGYGKVVAAEGSEITVAPVVMRGDKRYIALQDEAGAWSFHRLAMWLSAVTLRTEGNPGIYYKATYQADEVLRDLVDSYGVALSLQDMPGADFETADKYTAYGTEDFAAAYSGNKVNTVSGAVVGIMKEKNSKETNTANAQMEIYANAYLKLNIGEEGLLIMANSKDQGKTSDAEDFTGAAYSLFEVLDGVNENWDGYSDEEKATIQEFLTKWAAYITDEAVAALQTSLDKIFTPGEVVM